MSSYSYNKQGDSGARIRMRKHVKRRTLQSLLNDDILKASYENDTYEKFCLVVSNRYNVRLRDYEIDVL